MVTIFQLGNIIFVQSFCLVTLDNINERIKFLKLSQGKIIINSSYNGQKYYLQLKKQQQIDLDRHHSRSPANGPVSGGFMAKLVKCLPSACLGLPPQSQSTTTRVRGWTRVNTGRGKNWRRRDTPSSRSSSMSTLITSLQLITSKLP